MLLIFVIVLTFLGVNGENSDCGTIKCDESLKPKDCPEGTYFDPFGSKDRCCAACRGGLAWGDSKCNDKKDAKRCAPGLICNKDKTCVLDRRNCFHTLHFEEYVGWTPKCERDGSYAAVQCRGDRLTGRCFCYSETGQQIYGSDWWKNADDMSCACSRKRHKLEQSGRLEVTLHCLPNGNFEQLQCDDDICWCSEEDGRQMEDTVAVPPDLMKFLSCYNKTMHGDMYLRKCDSVAYAQGTLRKTMRSRGTNGATMNLALCNYDGSYGYYRLEGNLAFCQLPDGKKLAHSAPARDLRDMNCNCALDEELFKNAGLVFPLICSFNGNYEPIQNGNGKVFCVDKFGFAVSELMEYYSELDCNDFIYSAQKDMVEEDDYDNYY